MCDSHQPLNGADSGFDPLSIQVIRVPVQQGGSFIKDKYAKIDEQDYRVEEEAE